MSIFASFSIRERVLLLAGVPCAGMFLLGSLTLLQLFERQMEIYAAIFGLTLFVAYVLVREILGSLVDASDRIGAKLDKVSKGEVPNHDELQRIGRDWPGLPEMIMRVSAAEQERRAQLAEIERLAAEKEALTDRELSTEREARHGERNRRAALEAAIHAFEREAGAMLDDFSKSAGEFEAAARALGQIADGTSSQSSQSSEACESTSRHVEAVATTASVLCEALTQALSDMGQMASDANETLDETRQARSETSKLADVAERIDDITALIDTIAGKTNFLALNATIEAAQKGMAQAGFGVIAQELKALTVQTTAKAQEISELIEEAHGLMTAVSAAVDGLETRAVRQADTSLRMADTFRAQGDATSEMVESLHGAAESSRSVAASSHAVSGIARRTRAMSADLLSAAEQVSTTNRDFRAVYERFVEHIRAA